MTPESFTERLVYAGYSAADLVARALPEAWGRAIFQAGAHLAHLVAPSARRTVRSNLAPVLGRSDDDPLVAAAAHEAFVSYARYWYDTFRIRTMPDREFLRRFSLDGKENLRDAVEAGTGAVLALPHIGNWDAAGKGVHLEGWDITAVAEVLRPERLFRLFLDHRRDLGMGIVPLYDDQGVARELVRLIGTGELIALVSDRDLKGRGVVVKMFGRERRIPAGPALLALATGAPLLPCSVYDRDDGWSVFVGPPLEIERTGKMREDVVALTRALAERFERAISAAPTQWHMFQPAWG